MCNDKKIKPAEPPLKAVIEYGEQSPPSITKLVVKPGFAWNVGNANKEIQKKIDHAEMVIKNCYRKDGKVHPGLNIVIERKTRLVERLKKELIK